MVKPAIINAKKREMSSERLSSERLSLKTKILFGLGDVYGGGGFQLVSFFYAIFLSDTLGLNMKLIPIVLLSGKVWDAISDPMMGWISDRTKSRWGRRHPYFLFGSIAVALSYVLLFWPFSSESQTALLAFAVIAYLLFCTIWTIVMVPYFAFGAEISLDYNERTSATTFRLLFSLIGSLLASAVPTAIISGFGSNTKLGYLVMAAVFGVLFGLSVLAVFFSKKEVYRPDINKDKVGFITSFINALKIRSFRQYVGMFIFGMLGIDIVSMIMAYYTRYYLRMDGVLATFLTVALVSQLVMLPLWSFIAKKFGKRTAYMAGGAIWVVMGTILFFMPATAPLPAILGFIVLVSMGMGAVMFIPHTILGDITDVAEFAYGKRQEGSFSGFATLIRKCSSGIGLAAVTGVLGFLGYITPPEGTTNFTLIYQPPVVESAIKLFISLVPVALVLVGVFIAGRYQVTRENHKMLITHLNSLREGGPGTLTEDEVLALRRLLISKKA